MVGQRWVGALARLITCTQAKAAATPHTRLAKIRGEHRKASFKVSITTHFATASILDPNVQHTKNLSKWRTTRERSSTCEFLTHFSHEPTDARTTKFTNNPSQRITVTSPASARPPTASSRPRTTLRFRSPSPRLTRTAVPSRARTMSTLSAVSSAPWARVTMP